MYDLWLLNLTTAVAKYDEEFTSQVELSWHVILAPGIAFMKYSYEHEDIQIDEYS